ncbi:MAG: site-specific integrase [Methylococcaceae bacterium]
MATKYKDSRTGIYYLNWIDPDTGKRYRQPISKDHDLARDKDYADQVLAELNYKVQTGKLKKHSGITLAEFMIRYLTHAESRKTNQGIVRDQYIVKHMSACFGPDKLAEEIDLAEIDHYIAYRQAQGVKTRKKSKKKGSEQKWIIIRAKELSNATINRELNTIKRMFVWGAKRKIICENRIRDYELLPVKESKRQYFDDIEKLQKLLAATDLDFRVFVMLILYTGIRISKLTPRDLEDENPLTWREINFEMGLIDTVNTKTGKRILIPLAPDIAKLLSGYKAKIKAEDKDRLFPWAYGAVRSKFVRLRKKLDLDGFTLNSLRHTFATYSSMTGGDHLATSIAMGHTSMSTTNIYTKIPIERLKAATSKLNFLQEADPDADIFADILTPGNKVSN